MRQHSLRLPDELMEAVDSARGLVPRNSWIVDVLRREVRWVEREPVREQARRDVEQKPPAPVVERSPEPGVDIMDWKASERTVRGPVAQPRPIVQKRGKL